MGRWRGTVHVHEPQAPRWDLIKLLLWWQVLPDGEEGLQRPPLPQLDARLLRLALLLPALQKPRAVQLPRVRFKQLQNVYFGVIVLLMSKRDFFSFPCRDIEILALFVSCMCHDLDHRGTNNSFQVASVRAWIHLCVLEVQTERSGRQSVQSLDKFWTFSNSVLVFFYLIVCGV